MRRQWGHTPIQLSDHFTYRRLIRFTVPSIANMIFLSIYGVVDGFFVSNYVGGTPFAALNLIMPFIMIFSAVGFMFGTGGRALVAVTPVIGYHYGAENKEELHNVYRKSLLLIGVAAVVMTAAAELLAGPLAMIFASRDAALLTMTTHAIRVYALSFLVMGFNFFGSSFFTALNNGLVSAALSFLRVLVFQIISVLLLPALFGLNGVWMAVILAELLAVGVTIWVLRHFRGKYGYA